jgi:hypothetical protein
MTRVPPGFTCAVIRAVGEMEITTIGPANRTEHDPER